MSGPSAVSCRGITLRYGTHAVLDGLDLELLPAETVALLGPSGSGKTTLLYAIAGLLEPDAGVIEIGGRVVVGDGPRVPPERRSVGMVFQNYALWPHLSAVRTVAYPMERHGVAAAVATAAAMRLLDSLGIADLADRLPDQMSGGQQQRVGLARALAVSPALYLFDEPTAHLDAGQRRTLQHELVAHGARSGAAILYTTHDAAEAFAVADRVAVLREGRIVQIGTPDEVYRRPRDRWVAGLTGPASLLRARVRAVAGEQVDVEIGDSRFRVSGLGCSIGDDVEVVVRPDWATIGGAIDGVVDRVRYEGPHTDYSVDTRGGVLQVREPGRPRLEVGATTGIGLAAGWILATSAD